MSMPRSISTESVRDSQRKVDFTPAARRALAAVSHRDGQQAVLLAWPAGAAYLPLDHYAPHDFDVILGHVEGCPVYADTRRLALFRNHHVVLDVDPDSPSVRYPTLSARPLPSPELDWETTPVGPATRCSMGPRPEDTDDEVASGRVRQVTAVRA